MSGHVWDSVQQVYQVIGTLPAKEQVFVLQCALLMVASNARTEALIEPGGFQAARDRQVEQLRRMADAISQDVPDLEAERLFHERDVQGLTQHFLDRLREASDGDENA